MSQPWWRTSVVYQVYPRSFADSNGDGYGDLPGLIDRLDYIQALGADVVWVSPFYPSPQADNGYDIGDYQGVDPLFGTIADVDRLIAQLHARGMKLVIDIVVNHTSDEHPWFLEARSSRESPRREWYWWRPPREGMAIDPVELVHFCEPRMAYFAVPRYLEFMDALPATENGKVQKFKLRERGITPAAWDREAAGIQLKR